MLSCSGCIIALTSTPEQMRPLYRHVVYDSSVYGYVSFLAYGPVIRVPGQSFLSSSAR